MDLIGLLVLVLVICVVVWATRALLTAFKIEDPIRTVIYVLVAIVILAVLVNRFGGYHFLR